MIKKYKGMYKKFVTITFGDNEQFLEFRKKDWNKLRKNLRNVYGVVFGFWVLEIQERGFSLSHIIIYKKEAPLIDKMGLL